MTSYGSEFILSETQGTLACEQEQNRLGPLGTCRSLWMQVSVKIDPLLLKFYKILYCENLVYSKKCKHLSL